MFKKIIAVTLLIAFSSLMLPHSAHAGVWGEAWASTQWQVTVEQMLKKIEETLVANLKIAAIRIIQARLNSLIGGTGMGGPKFVTNWRDEIYGSARRDSSVVVNNYFQNVKSGTGNEGRKIVSVGESAYKTNPLAMRPNIDQFAPQGLANIFKSGTPNPWLAWDAAEQLQNQPFLYFNNASSLFASSYGELSGANAAALQASQGVKSTTKGSNAQQGGKYGPAGYGTENEGHESISEKTVTMPGSIIKDTWAEVQNMPTQMLTLARSLPEIATAMVSQMITQMIQQGVTNINSQIDRQINQFRSQSGLPINQIQNYIQGGVRSVPNIPIR